MTRRHHGRCDLRDFVDRRAQICCYRCITPAPPCRRGFIDRRIRNPHRSPKVCQFDFSSSGSISFMVIPSFSSTMSTTFVGVRISSTIELPAFRGMLVYSPCLRSAISLERGHRNRCVNEIRRRGASGQFAALALRLRIVVQDPATSRPACGPAGRWNRRANGESARRPVIRRDWPDFEYDPYTEEWAPPPLLRFACVSNPGTQRYRRERVAASSQGN